jgi:hypothetical protein
MEENIQDPVQGQELVDAQGGLDLTTIDKMSYDKFIETLGDSANDPKLKAAISSGLKDGNKEDDVFDFTVEVGIPVRGCKPTQSEVVVSKSLSYPLKNTDKESLETLLTSTKGKSYTAGGPIVVFSDGSTNYVIDGHHRWSQVHVVNPDAFITGLVMTSKVPGTDAKEVLKAVQMAILKVVQDNAAEPVLPAAEGAGNNPEANLFECSEAGLKKYVAETAGPDFLEVAKETNKIEEATAEAAADYIWKNVLDLRKNSSPIPGATKREAMPQTDGADNLKDAKATAVLKAGKWRDELISGVINHAAPYESKKWIKTFEQFKGNR